MVFRGPEEMLKGKHKFCTKLKQNRHFFQNRHMHTVKTRKSNIQIDTENKLSKDIRLKSTVPAKAFWILFVGKYR